jgi:hypothetical protein
MNEDTRNRLIKFADSTSESYAILIEDNPTLYFIEGSSIAKVKDQPLPKILYYLSFVQARRPPKVGEVYRYVPYLENMRLCTKCGHTWITRLKNKEPVECPKCKVRRDTNQRLVSPFQT